MEETDYRRVFLGNFVIVPLIKDELNSIGITPIIKDESESGRLAGFPTSMQDIQEVLVHKDEYEKAMAVVDRIKQDTEDNWDESE